MKGNALDICSIAAVVLKVGSLSLDDEFGFSDKFGMTTAHPECLWVFGVFVRFGIWEETERTNGRINFKLC